MKNLVFPTLLALLLMPAVALAEIDKKQATAIAQGVHPGRVLAVKQVQENGKSVFRVKTLSDSGDVHVVVIDAGSGEVISK